MASRSSIAPPTAATRGCPRPASPATLHPTCWPFSPNYVADQTLFAAGYGALHRSTDGGATWQALSAPPNYSLAISPNFAADHTLWAMYREIEGSAMQPEAGIVRSTDGGATWSNVTAGWTATTTRTTAAWRPTPAARRSTWR
jgi:photosystem II stability/assembly factor-like uncharacterized protein